MKTITIMLLALFAGLLTQTLVSAGTSSDLDRIRSDFIRDFQRIGMNSTPEDARLLRILLEARNAKLGVEVGSATGYGAINMGVGFERTGGKLVTVDIDPEMYKASLSNVKQMKLEDTVECVLGDALAVLPDLEGEFDFVFIDARKRDYLKYLKAIEPKLAKGAVVVADNVIRFKDDMQDYLDYVHDSGEYETVVVRASDIKRDGMAISYKRR